MEVRPPEGDGALTTGRQQLIFSTVADQHAVSFCFMRPETIRDGVNVTLPVPMVPGIVAQHIWSGRGEPPSCDCEGHHWRPGSMRLVKCIPVSPSHPQCEVGRVGPVAVVPSVPPRHVRRRTVLQSSAVKARRTALLRRLR